MNEIEKYLNEQSVKGDLAREFKGIIDDYNAGTLGLQDKNDLIEAVVQSFKNSDKASDEVTLRWVILVANVAGSIV
jgi:hypothetical protein